MRPDIDKMTVVVYVMAGDLIGLFILAFFLTRCFHG